MNNLTVIFLTVIVAYIGMQMMKTDWIYPVSYTLPDAVPLVGPLAPNEVLTKSVKLAHKQVLGPESIIVHEGNVYTGVVFGRIMKINKNGETSVFLQQGKGNCTTMWACGRPLGMRLHPSKEFFYVADAYLGVFKVDLNTAKAERVFPFDDNFKVTLFNDVEILPDGNLIVSETSVRWPLHELMSEVLEGDGNGRLIHVNLKERKFEVIATELCFSNGLVLDRQSDSTAVLVAETTRNRITRIFLTGPRQGEKEVFADLPGMPDNIRATENGRGYWVGLASIRQPGKQNLVERLSTWPRVRRFVHKFLPIHFLHQIARQHYGIVVKLDLTGRIVGSLHDPTGAVVRDVAEVTEHDGTLYLGNYDNIFLGRLDKGSYEVSEGQL